MRGPDALTCVESRAHQMRNVSALHINQVRELLGWIMSRRDDIKKLIAKNTRRLQKLNEKKASFGLDTPTHILVEIEDVEAELEKLNSQLDRVKAAEDISSDESHTSILQSNNFKILMFGIGVAIIVVLSVSIPIVGGFLATPTPTVTSTFTATSTPTATATSTPTATPTEEILFEEDFEDDEDGFFNQRGGDWEIVEDHPGNKVYEVNTRDSDSFHFAYFGKKDWEKYVVEFKANIVDFDPDPNKENAGFVFLGFRNSKKGGYRVSLSDSGLIALWYEDYEDKDTGWDSLKSTEFNFQKDTWYSVRIEVDGTEVRVFLDDDLMLVDDDSPSLDERPLLGVGSYTIARFDDIRVTELRR